MSFWSTRAAGTLLRFVRKVAHSATRAIAGEEFSPPDEHVRSYPALLSARWRRGGLPPRVGGWALGKATVAGIALGRTVFLAPGVFPHPELLLHELAHVHQFARVRNFPLRYLWASIRHGYHANRFESEANDFAASQLSRPTSGA